MKLLKVFAMIVVTLSLTSIMHFSNGRHCLVLCRSIILWKIFLKLFTGRLLYKMEKYDCCNEVR
jgi:hypothetical protein